MERLKAHLTVLILILTSFMALVSGTAPTGALVIDTFAGDLSEQVLKFEAGGGTDDSIIVLVPDNSKVTSATLNVTGVPYTPGGTDFAEEIKLDFGANGNNDWMWKGTGIGAFGHQSLFSDDSVRTTMDFTEPGTNLSASIKIPTNATVTDANFEIWGGTVEGLNEIEYGGNNLDWMGYDVTGAGDLNGDGISDFAASAPHKWPFSNAHVYIWFGNATPKAQPDLDIIYHLGSDDWFGHRVSGAGDVNNDGYDDLIVGAGDWDNPTLSDPGAAFIYYGGDPMDTSFDVRLEGPDSYDEMGFDVSGIGDVNDDGFDDVLVGAPYNNSLGSYTGAAYLYFGGDPMNNVSDLNFSGGGSWFYFGYMVSGAGDFDNDGYADFMIGAHGDDTNGNHDGAAYIYRGGPSLDNVSDVNIRPLGTTNFGSHGAGVGDLNGDGFDDVAITNDYNEVWIYHGDQFLDGNRDLRINGEFINDRFGIGVDGAGDLNNDGYDDLIVGAWGHDLNKGYGKSYIYKGGSNMDTVADFTRVGDEVTYELGISVAGVGDFNDDGFSDVIIGADGTNASGTRAGSVFLEMYFKGVRNPYIGIQDTTSELWSYADYFSGLNISADFAPELNSAITVVGTTETDLFGNTFSEVTLNVTTMGQGDLRIKNLTIYYDLTVTVPDFKNELNYFMDQNDPSADGFYHIPIRVMSNSKGGVRIDGLDILINEAPHGTAPQGLALPEGSVNSTFLDIYDIFTDDFDIDEELTLNLKSHTNGTYVDVFLVDDHYLKLDALKNTSDVNWTGRTQVVMNAVDTDGLKSADLTLDIEISNVPDPPLVTSSPPIEAMEGSLFEYQILAIDGDDDVLGYSMASGPGNVTIDPSSGALSWVPSVDEVGLQDIVIMISDGTFNVTHDINVAVSLRIHAGNTLPIINSRPILQGTVGVQYIYNIDVFDSDYDPITFTLVEGPDGMTIDKTTGRIVWLPIEDDVGSHPIVINVSDGKDRVFQRYTLKVTDLNANHLPEIVGTPPTVGYVGIEYYFEFNSTDPDGDPVTFSLVSGPIDMGLSGRGVLSWTPTPGDNKAHKFTVKLSDGKGFTTKEFEVDILRNHAPTFISNPILDAKVNEEYRYKIMVSDQDAGDTVVIELTRWPYGMILDNETNELVWTPSETQVGDNEVSVKIFDGKHSISDDFTITVKEDKKIDTGNEGDLGFLLYLLIIMAIIIVAILAAWAMTRKKGPEGESILEDVFLIYGDGRLVSHHTRRLKPETDEYSLTAMLTAIQEFVKESIPTEGEEQKAIDEISFGDNRILLSHGKYLYIAAVVKGPANEEFKGRMQDALNDIEGEFGSRFKDWDGDLKGMDNAKLRMKALLMERAEEEEEEGPEGLDDEPEEPEPPEEDLDIEDEPKPRKRPKKKRKKKRKKTED